MQTHTPVRARRSRRVHAVPMSGEGVMSTLCGRKYQGTGWAIADRPVNCMKCLIRIGEPIEPGEHVA